MKQFNFDHTLGFYNNSKTPIMVMDDFGNLVTPPVPAFNFVVESIVNCFAV